MASAFQELVEFIQNGEAVNAGVANRAPRAIDGNTRFIRDLLELILAGETIIARGKTVNANVSVGQPVYFNPTSQQFELAIAATETDATTSQIVTSKSSQVWGIVLCKANATNADILLSGIADVDLSNAIDGTVQTGIYYLSGSETGKLISTRPPVGVQVLQVSQQGAKTGEHEVFVNTKFMDFLEQHRHVKFGLVALPAGTHSPPARPNVHTITSPDVTTEGWLPANHASFNGLAPVGAKFGYNLTASTLGKVWPPLPIENVVIQIRRQSTFTDVKELHFDALHDFPSVAAQSTQEQAFPTADVIQGDQVLVTPQTQLPAGLTVDGAITAPNVVTVRLTNSSSGPINPGAITYHISVLPNAAEDSVKTPGLITLPPELVIADINGIWWLTDCYNQVPWPTDLDTVAPTSESVSESCPVQVGDVIIDLWYSDLLFYTQDSAVLSLRGAAGSGISFTCVNTDDEKSVGHLEANFDLSLLVDDQGLAGANVVKTFVDNVPILGPVVESLVSGSPELTVTATTPGNLKLTANLSLNGTEFPVDTVRLDGVEEEDFSDVLALGFSATRAAEFRGRVRVPSHLALPAGTKMKLRFWVMGRVAGTIPAAVFTVSRRNLTKPTAVLTDEVTLPLVDTSLSMTTGATLAAANEYILMETAEFAVATGDKIYFTLKRSAPDGYAGELHIIYQEGVLVVGS